MGIGTKTCTCGSKNVARAKFGGQMFLVSAAQKTNWIITSGDRPIPFVCKDCGKVEFYLETKVLDKY